MQLTVREITNNDIAFFISYWRNSDKEYLKSMGVDCNKIPSANDLTNMLRQQINSDYESKQTYALIWECNGEVIGHSNINEIEFGKTAKIHLHIWEEKNRKKGFGKILLKKSIAIFFEKFRLKEINCETFAENKAPIKSLQNLGFQFIKKYETIPNSISFKQEVNLWSLTKEKFNRLNLTS